MADDSAATAIEYGLIAALVGAAMLAALGALGGGLGGVFDWLAQVTRPALKMRL
jgi:pilus assembly protein Flp/PilA